ncbi:50S ribosomal protein L7/L12 [Candidatus Cytomitobacter primus]|uniref:Large ribosomal subunit protein bL12 n=1 Tax=Candidatus Cytomitobacter primus TaxID=2066024 RepID=A0A5C0UF80_9PROT|nr:50S ribosomal protein L7/L12 [Candidatus Cytomitobacter primus]QEK38370.1 50S ribosomal protein L7/L12 [Candidatus Cytomitobacter primus]|eukprot:TRINITY_DN17595_c0_g2_i1.p2 TRINITY_DN17595_c0_g2~~TRINITY_DN17595_c0_g2_i1.p2  ORF type:complete len:121 (+),score=12.46 TRINITY_DN17595_c0_g2_i1:730-1092(+)
MNINKNELLETIGGMSVSDLLELVGGLEEKWGVSAAAAAAPAAAAADQVEEKSKFEVVIESTGDKKVAVIKAVRAITGLGLKEAKEKADNAGSSLGEFNKEDAEAHKKALEEAGAKVALK